MRAYLPRWANGPLFLEALLLVTISSLAKAEIGDRVADAVLGAANFTDAITLPLGPASFAVPRGIAIDRSVTPNRVYVADSFYHRILGWNNIDALSNGAPADLVIGQPDFTSIFCNQNPYNSGIQTTPTLSSICDPRGLAVDGAGNLYVADSGNCRVLIFKDPFGTDQVADAVLGQSTGCTNSVVDQAHLFDPHAVAVDSAGNVYVGDTLDCRVLEYDQPLTTDLIPDRVFGQADFTHPVFGQGSWCSRAVGGIEAPEGLSVDSNGRLYVASEALVYEYDTPLSKTTWDHSLGTTGCNVGGETASTTCGPIAAVADAAGALYVADVGSSRILEFDSPFTVSQASRVFGQPDFTGSATYFNSDCNTGGPSAASLCLRADLNNEGAALAIDDHGSLWVADAMNSRVLRYDNPLNSDAVADLVLGHTTMDDVREPFVAAPQPGITLDNTTYTVLIVDSVNSRILIQGYDRPFGVIGQPGFNSTDCNSGGLSAASLCHPTAAITAGGNLWVADSGNNRVLEYQAPWYTVDQVHKQIVIKQRADQVFGQTDFVSNSCRLGADGLCAPQGVAFDAHGDLYISDTGNNRILLDQNPSAGGAMKAERVFGQADFNSGDCKPGSGGASTLCDPRGITVLSHIDPWGVDQGDDLYVADRGNHRVVLYQSVMTKPTGAAADKVFGQGGNMSGGSCGQGTDGLCHPTGVATDRGGNLLIADTDNNRVLEFTDPLLSSSADFVFGQSDFNDAACNAGGISAQSLCQPTGISVDAGLDRVYIADAGNQRVLRYDAPYCIGDFQLTPATRMLRGLRSAPKNTALRVVYGSNPSTADDTFKFSGNMVLLERDGGICLGCGVPGAPVVTLSTSNGVVFQGEINYLDNIRVTPSGGIYQADLTGMIDSGIDKFWVNESFYIPPGFSDAPQRDRFRFTGEAIGLDLSKFTESAATLRMQFGSACFTTALKCTTTKRGRQCVPAKK
jgi:sugar lactone lactonase YvrE